MKRSIPLLLLLIFPLWAPGVAPALSPEEIVARSDRVRNPFESYSVRVEALGFRPGREPFSAAFEVWVRGLDRSLVRFLEPARDLGKLLLMRQDDLWIYLPTIRNPVRIAPHQRLLGQISYGDVARTNFSLDYVPRRLENVDFEGRAAYLAELEARDLKKAYPRVLLWVAGEDFSPLRAEFYSLSGKRIKTALYRGSRQNGPGNASLEIADGLRAGEYSVLRYGPLQPREFPEAAFSKGFLRTLE